MVLGSSPRVRSRLRPLTEFNNAQRIISACAEQTRVGGALHPRGKDHLRVCGADAVT